MWLSEKQQIAQMQERIKELEKQIKQADILPLTLSWWKTIDMNDQFLINLMSKMYGSTNQRIMQLYIIRNNLNLKIK